MFGIIGAMDVEIESIISNLEDKKIVTKSSITFTTGKIGSTELVVAMCSPGKVNAAICTQVMLDNFLVSLVINVGVGCAIGKDVAIGDIVVATDVCEYDMDITALGEPKGYFECYDLTKFPCSSDFSDTVSEIAESLNKKVHRGTIASGDTFISSNEIKSQIIADFDAVAGEMEGGAIGHTCYQNKIPFAVIRSISDGGDENAQMDYPTFKKIAAENSTAIILKLFEN